MKICTMSAFQVRLELKKLWYKVQGRKLDLDENIAGTRSSVYSVSNSACLYMSRDSRKPVFGVSDQV